MHTRNGSWASRPGRRPRARRCAGSRRTRSISCPSGRGAPRRHYSTSWSATHATSTASAARRARKWRARASWASSTSSTTRAARTWCLTPHVASNRRRRHRRRQHVPRGRGRGRGGRRGCAGGGAARRLDHRRGAAYRASRPRGCSGGARAQHLVHEQLRPAGGARRAPLGALWLPVRLPPLQGRARRP